MISRSNIPEKNIKKGDIIFVTYKNSSITRLYDYIIYNINELCNNLQKTA